MLHKWSDLKCAFGDWLLLLNIVTLLHVVTCGNCLFSLPSNILACDDITVYLSDSHKTFAHIPFGAIE